MGAKHVLDDNSETPDTQVAVYDFPTYTLIFEHQIQGGIGPNGKEHGMLFSGSEGTLTIDGDGWRVQVEEKRKKIEAVSRPAGPDARPAHVRNFLDCVKSRQQPVENLEVGHHVSTVAHLGNLAYRTKTEIHWDSKKERAVGNKAANELVECHYRKPWKLPYSRS
jgi:predicted dehydrogenase